MQIREANQNIKMANTLRTDKLLKSQKISWEEKCSLVRFDQLKFAKMMMEQECRFQMEAFFQINKRGFNQFSHRL